MEKNHKVELIGRPSIDRPWMKYYPESISKLQVPELSLNEYLKANCPGMDMVARLIMEEMFPGNASS